MTRSVVLVWCEHPRDWRWLFLRRKTVQRRQTITPSDMSGITLLDPHPTPFLDLMERYVASGSD